VKKRYAIYGIILVGLYALAVWDEVTPSAEQQNLLETTRELSSLMEVVVQPEVGSGQTIRLVITNSSDLVEIHNDLQHSDLKPVSGHSGEIFDRPVTFTTTSGAILKVRSTVHKYEPEDLFLSRNLFLETKPGVFVAAGKSNRIRVPKLGSWIMRKIETASPKPN
jgi:hypothetical protein